MRAEKFVESRLSNIRLPAGTRGAGDPMKDPALPAYPGRVPNDRAESPPPVYILFRKTGAQRFDLVDGATPDATVFFEIECRAPTCPGAQSVGAQVLAGLSPQLTHILSEYDEPDDPGQQRGDYFSYVLNVGLPALVEGVEGA